MAGVKGEPLGFISYCHKDKAWLDKLQTCLTPYLRGGSITAWSDEQIVAGSRWHEEIQSAVSSATVAVLLVTQEFLASDYIHEHELNPILEKAKQREVRILWIPIKPCAFHKTPLKDLQAIISPADPLAGRNETQQDAAWVEICDEIEKAINPR